MAKDEGKKEIKVSPVEQKNKPTFSYEVTDESKLKEWSIGDMCLLKAKGKVVSVNKRTYDSESAIKGNITFELDDVQVENISEEDKKEADNLDIDIEDQNEMKKLREKKKNEPK